MQPLIPVLACYLLSFVFLGIYWNNHHHMLQITKRVNGASLWANMHLLFWLSLIPFVTNWMGEHSTSHWPIALYGFILCMCGVSYYILSKCLIAADGADSALAVALGNDLKGKASVAIYLAAIGITWVAPCWAYACYVTVAIMWIVPDRRIERMH